MLPTSTRPAQSNMVNEPNYCPLHRSLSHTIEDCFIFKDWLEKAIQDGVFAFSPKATSSPKKREVNVIHLPQEPRCSCPMSSRDIIEGKSCPPLDESCHSIGHGSPLSNDDDEDYKGVPWTLVSRKKPGPKPSMRSSSSSQLESPKPINQVPTVFLSQKEPRKERKSRRGKSIRFGASAYDIAKAAHDKQLEQITDDHIQKDRHPVSLDEYMPKGW